MAGFRYSRVARLELLDIIEYTRNQWGDAQARSYFDSLETTLRLLAQYPLAGRTFGSRKQRWRRKQAQGHCQSSSGAQSHLLQKLPAYPPFMTTA
jgi:plasmid stabilization system protein ParE